MVVSKSDESESLFRSEIMHLYQFIIQEEAAFDCLSNLGDLGCVQFRDLNENLNSFQRTYVSEVRRCDLMDRRLRYLHAELKRENIPMASEYENPDAPHPKEFSQLEVILEKLEIEVRDVQQNAVALRTNYYELLEINHLLTNSNEFFKDNTQSINTIAKGHFKEDHENTSSLGLINGVIRRERMAAFELMIWRICRGNVYMHTENIPTAMDDPKTGEATYKSIFILLYHGDQLHSRIRKVCAGFHATLYDIPDRHADRVDMSDQVLRRIVEMETVLEQTRDHERRVLGAVTHNIRSWLVQVLKSKAIFHHMNMFNAQMTHKKCLIGEGWIPAGDVERVRQALLEATRTVGTSVQQVMTQLPTKPDEQTPTYNRTNKFTRGFQVLIDSYGVNTYREMNPAPYAVISFPFLFAMMFGDIGHGCLMSLFAFWMIRNEKQIAAQHSTNEIWNIFYGGRYVIQLMGLFSIYTGLIYNDCFGQSLNLFGSAWTVHLTKSELLNSTDLELNPAVDCTVDPYPFGIDPIWNMAVDNKIVFQNSFKMKMSIIFGVLQMFFGVCLSLKNYVNFKQYSSIVLEFLPQIIFLSCIFVYLSLLMVIKWFLYSTRFETVSSEGCAPLILITFINMMLLKQPEKIPPCSPFMFAGQDPLQLYLLIVALLCVPVMLLGHPLFVLRERKMQELRNARRSRLMHRPSLGGEGSPPPENEAMSEVFIHQAIFTIEYVLGTVSHTASYLRLWALSLAHSQLSEVLWNRVMSTGLRACADSIFGVIVLSLIFAAWAALTIAILVVMEALSAFLHTLRLHWVEFQSKFYSGEGVQFAPFSFRLYVASQMALMHV